MNLLERKYGWFWLLLTFLTGGSSIIILANLIGVLDENAWYMKGKNWIIALLCLVYPLIIMFGVFLIQLTCQVAAELEVPGKEIYLSPYIWLLCVIVPVIGWIMLIVMILYIEIGVVISIYKGNGENIKIA